MYIYILGMANNIYIYIYIYIYTVFQKRARQITPLYCQANLSKYEHCSYRRKLQCAVDKTGKENQECTMIDRGAKSIKGFRYNHTLDFMIVKARGHDT